MEILYNDEPILYEEDNAIYELFFFFKRYAVDDTLAILCYEANGCYFSDVSVNLSAYNIHPSDRYIYLNRDIAETFKELVVDLFSKDTFENSGGTGIVLKDEILNKLVC